METKKDKSKLPERLKFIRAQYGWSAREFAEKLGISLPTIQTYESGRYYPKVKTLQKMQELTRFINGFAFMFRLPNSIKLLSKFSSPSKSSPTVFLESLV